MGEMSYVTWLSDRRRPLTSVCNRFAAHTGMPVHTQLINNMQDSHPLDICKNN